MAEINEEAEAARLRGVEYKKAGMLDKAEEEYQKALQLQPGYARVFYNLGTLYYEDKEEYDKAIENYTEAIVRQPTGQQPDEGCYYYARGRCYREKEDYDRAFADAAKAIELNPNESDFYEALGHCYANKGNPDKAIENYEQALRIDPDNESAKNNLKNARDAKTGRKSETVGELRKNCPSCGTPIESFQTRCPNCGHELNAAEESSHFKKFVDDLEDVGRHNVQVEVCFFFRSGVESAIAEQIKIQAINTPDGSRVEEGDVLVTYSSSELKQENLLLKAPAAGTVSYAFNLSVGQWFGIYNEDAKKKMVWASGDKLKLKIAAIITDEVRVYEHSMLDANTRQWNQADENQRFWVENHVLPNTKEDLLELLIFASGKIAQKPKSIYEETWNGVWKRKCKQIYAKARLCLKTDAATLKSIEEILAENGVK
jgi:tetratricopeptide (TPR) repeat protein